MPRGLLPFVARRLAAAALLVFAVSSAALVLARLAPPAHGPDVDPAVAAEECARIRCNDPLLSQYSGWLGSALRLDLGESLRYRRPVGALVAERAGNSVLLGVCALLLATLVGIPAGVLSGSRRAAGARAARAGSMLLLSIPPLVWALALLLLASRVRWLPVGGMPAAGAPLVEHLRYLLLPVLALGLPMAATLERLQSAAIAEALEEPCLVAAAARGVAPRRLLWRHAWKLSLNPVLAIYGIVVGTLISGSFVVEYVMAWPGLGGLMYDALVARDPYLVAGCAAAGALALAAGILASDVALASLDPRTAEGR